MKRIIVVALVLFISTFARAEENSHFNELGVTLGTPAGVNINSGVWGLASTALIVRGSGMYWGKRLNGFQLEVGWPIQMEHAFKHYASLAFVEVHADSSDWKGLGPIYGINWCGFSGQVGLTFGAETNPGTSYNIRSPQLVVQLGYTFLY